MCKIMQDFVMEERADAKAERNVEFAKKLLKQNRMTIEEIAEITELPLETVKQIAEKHS